MAFDPETADRIRELIAAGPSARQVTERQMFGGLAFLVGGNMAIAAGSQGDVLVRVDPQESDLLAARTAAEPAVMGGRTMRGWLQVGPAGIATKRQLSAWVDRGVSYAASLPAKGPGAGRTKKS